MLQFFPLEILEVLILYVSVEDLLNVWLAVGLEGSDLFWQKVCRRQGFKKVFNEDEVSWKTVFRRNLNWRNQAFVKREYNISTVGSLSSNSSNPKAELIGKNLFLCDSNSTVYVWNISSFPTYMQALPKPHFKHKGNKIIVITLSSATIYSCVRQTFYKIFTLLLNLPYDYFNYYSLTDEVFAVADQQTCSVKIVDLNNFEVYTLEINCLLLKVFKMTVVGNILSLLLLQGSQYILKRCCLINRIWLEDITLFQGAAMIGVPNLEINSNLIISWSQILGESGITPLKIFNADGKFLKSLKNVKSNDTDGMIIKKPLQRILWLLLGSEYVIFSVVEESFFIWTEKKHKIREIPKESEGYIGQNVISSSLLVLSFMYGFKVFDFKKEIYYYEVKFDKELFTNPIKKMLFFVNDYFYVLIYELEEENSELKQELDTSLFDKALPLLVSENITSPSSSYSQNLLIYDFESTNCS